jgi:hypothetical protein
MSTNSSRWKISNNNWVIEKSTCYVALCFRCLILSFFLLFTSCVVRISYLLSNLNGLQYTYCLCSAFFLCVTITTLFLQHVKVVPGWRQGFQIRHSHIWKKNSIDFGRLMRQRKDFFERTHQYVKPPERPHCYEDLTPGICLLRRTSSNVSIFSGRRNLERCLNFIATWCPRDCHVQHSIPVTRITHTHTHTHTRRYLIYTVGLSKQDRYISHLGNIYRVSHELWCLLNTSKVCK